MMDLVFFQILGYCGLIVVLSVVALGFRKVYLEEKAKIIRHPPPTYYKFD